MKKQAGAAFSKRITFDYKRKGLASIASQLGRGKLGGFCIIFTFCTVFHFPKNCTPLIANQN